jgi:hypothetical protein
MPARVGFIRRGPIALLQGLPQPADGIADDVIFAGVAAGADHIVDESREVFRKVDGHNCVSPLNLRLTRPSHVVEERFLATYPMEA